MNWKQRWTNEVLREIPGGSYRRRVESELFDHLETQYRALMDAGRTQDEAREEALRVMGAPETLQREYMTAWRRSWPARLEELGHRLLAWAGGLAVMFEVQLLVSYVVSTIGLLAYSLPGDSQNPWVRAIQSTVGDLNNSLFFRYLLPLLCALIAGAFFLSRVLQTSRHPAVLISAGLCVHWAHIAAFHVWLEALDNHRTFWEELKVRLPYSAEYYALALALCVLLGVVFGHMSARMRRSAAA